MKTKNKMNQKMHSLLSVLTTVVGVLLLIYMVLVEDEPGAIPLLLIVVGIGWYFITRSKIDSQHA